MTKSAGSEFIHEKALAPNEFREAIKKAVLSHRTKNPEKISASPQDVLEFLQACGQKPNPVQRFVLKLIYKIPLDKSTSDIEVWDEFHSNLRAEMSEVEYFDLLKKEGRINLPDPDYHLRKDFNPWKFVLPWGRRGGKSVIVGFIVAYEVYLLLHYYSPHDYFGIIETEEIRVMSVGPTKDQAETVRNYALACIDGHPFFKKYVLEDSQNRISFATEKMLDRKLNHEEAKERPGVVLATYPANERVVRSKGNMILVYDEIAHFLREGSVTSDETVVAAASPSQARFHKDGKICAKTFYISDPLDEAGVFWEEYSAALDEDGLETHIMVQVPSVEANPVAVPESYLREEKKRLGDKGFDAAYKAKFTLGMTSFIEDHSWLNCFRQEIKFQWRANPQVWYYVGIDLGFRRDKSTVAVVHRTSERSIVQDQMLVYWPKDYSSDMVLYEAILADLRRIYEIYQPRMSITDQHEGIGLKNACTRFQLDITGVHMTQFNHSRMSKLFQGLLRAGKFSTSSEAESLRDELVHLRKIERGRDLIRVEKSASSYDDEYDAVIRAVWAALELEQKQNRGTEIVHWEKPQTMASSTAAILQAQNFNTRMRGARKFNRWGQRR